MSLVAFVSFARYLAVQTWLDLRCATCVSYADINFFSSDVADSWRAPRRAASSTMH
ncbi:hypothetical protein ACWEK5_18970 [Rhodococcus koreensis]